MELVGLIVMAVFTAVVVIFGVFVCIYVGMLIIATRRKAKEQEEEEKSEQRDHF